jgi:hypothetical protein
MSALGQGGLEGDGTSVSRLSPALLTSEAVYRVGNSRFHGFVANGYRGNYQRHQAGSHESIRADFDTESKIIDSLLHDVPGQRCSYDKG